VSATVSRRPSLFRAVIDPGPFRRTELGVVPISNKLNNRLSWRVLNAALRAQDFSQLRSPPGLAANFVHRSAASRQEPRLRGRIGL